MSNKRSFELNLLANSPVIIGFKATNIRKISNMQAIGGDFFDGRESPKGSEGSGVGVLGGLGALGVLRVLRALRAPRASRLP